ncbi:MAG: DUF4163 domain-containing protein [Brevundimonas sp.]|nr:DUF4163 domain-containing protein [Brevundimonas sp.]
MSSPRMLLITALLATTALAACNRDKETRTDAAASPGGALVTPAAAAAPMSYESKSGSANVGLKLPDAIKGQPDLHARLFSEEVRKLQQFAEGAANERLESGEEGAPNWTYEKQVNLTAALETGKLLSLKRADFDFSGGAHPNTLTTGILWDKALKRQIGFNDLFQRGANLTALDQALCSAINAAKRARVPDSKSLTLGTGGDWNCPRASATEFVLTPGTEPGRAAGLTFLLGPYAVGPYAEGPYEIAIPVSAFRSVLAVAYADEFGGQLVKAGDVTPTAR